MLQPGTGGVFVVTVETLQELGESSDGEVMNREDGGSKVEKVVIWDRKVEGGFPGALLISSVGRLTKISIYEFSHDFDFGLLIQPFCFVLYRVTNTPGFRQQTTQTPCSRHNRAKQSIGPR